MFPYRFEIFLDMLSGDMILNNFFLYTLPPFDLRFQDIREKLLLTYSDATHSTFQLVPGIIVLVGVRLVRGGGGRGRVKHGSEPMWVGVLTGVPTHPTGALEGTLFLAKKLYFRTRVILISDGAGTAEQRSQGVDEYPQVSGSNV